MSQDETPKKETKTDVKTEPGASHSEEAINQEKTAAAAATFREAIKAAIKAFRDALRQAGAEPDIRHSWISRTREFRNAPSLSSSHPRHRSSRHSTRCL
jgi:hypothetical protein